jgi:hypothetical protein
MKKLGKLQINPEKVMKNKELMTLRGGYGDVACACKIGTTVLCSTEMVENCAMRDMVVAKNGVIITVQVMHIPSV